MSEAAKTSYARPLMWGGAAVALATVIGLYLIAGETRKAPADAPVASVPGSGVPRDLAKGSLVAFVIKSERKPVADLAFNDDKGNALQLSQWKGRVALVNLWATWCGPCRKEMPALAELQQKLGSQDFEVLAISIDRKGAEASGAFLKETGATALKLYVDTSADVLDKLQALGLPATVLVDRNGNEIGRMLGPAEWASPEAIALVQAAIAEK